MEWPAKAARFIAQPRDSIRSMYSRKLSKSQLMPACRLASDMPSTWVRFLVTRSRDAAFGWQGAIVKPQLPMIAVVTPMPTDWSR